MRITTAALALAGVLGGTAAWAQCDPGETIIKFSHVTAATGHPKGEAATLLAERVNAEMDGRICMEVFPNSQLYDDNKVLEALLTGDIQMAAPSLSKFEAFTKVYRIFDFPFLFADTDAVDAFQRSEQGEALLDAMRPQGLLGLGFWRNGMKQMSAKNPIVLPTDVDGLKFRVQPSEVLVAQFEQLGAVPQKMAFKEVYGALQTGVVDGQENTWSNIFTQKFFEVQDGVTATNHGVIDYLVVTSVEFWEGLPQADRAQLELILAEVTAQRNAAAFLINLENKQRILDAGSQVRELTADERAAWVRALRPVWDRFAGDVGEEALNAAISSNASIDERVLAFERRLIEEALSEASGDERQAAAILGLTQRDLQLRLRDHGLSAIEYR